MHIFIGDLTEDAASWDFITQAGKDSIDAKVLGKSSFTNFKVYTTITSLEFLKKESKDITFFGNLELLSDLDIENIMGISALITLRIVTECSISDKLLSHPKLRALRITRNVANMYLKDAVYTINNYLRFFSRVIFIRSRICNIVYFTSLNKICVNC
jgi:purine-nucleoside phosphorylase